MTTRNVFATLGGIVAVGAAIGVLAPLLQNLGNPANMGICVACFERDIAGAIGVHRAAVVQYLRPEILGFVLGALVAGLMFKEFKPSGGSAPMTRFMLGMVAIIGALIFLGCPWRAVLRLAGGDGNAILGILGLAAGVYIGTLFFRKGYNLGRSHKQSIATGLMLPGIVVGLLALRFMFPPEEAQSQSGILFYSVTGPGAAFAPLGIALGIGLAVGFLAQRSRFCTMGAIRDLILFRQFHLMAGVGALLVVAVGANMYFGQFNPGFEGQPVAHNLYFWNFFGMMVAGLAFALAGGCPGRQLFLSGEGNSDAALFVVGMVAGAALAHNWGLASSPAGLGPNGAVAGIIALGICLAVGFANLKKA